MRSMNRLEILMNQVPVGFWDVSRHGDHRLGYYKSWIDNPRSRPISLSLPLIPVGQYHTGPKVEAFFDNLLPDSTDIRRRLATRFKVKTIKPFDLLSEIGRDCVGAIQLLPENNERLDDQKIYPDGRAITDEEIGRLLKRITSGASNFNTGLSEEFRISVAGIQEKTALLLWKNQWFVPHGATPTTHILKLPIGALPDIDMSLSVENEWFCLNFLSGFGIPVPEVEIADFQDVRCLQVSRFDRLVSNETIIRLPQEDLCQVFSVYPSQKYESDGGPGIPDIMKLLLGAVDPERDRSVFFKTQILFWLLAAIDGHAKNFSIFLMPANQFRMTPVYDVLSAYPVTGNGNGLLPKQKLKMAMAVHGKNKHYKWDRITKKHWLMTAKMAGMNEETVTGLFEQIREEWEDAMEKALEKTKKSAFSSSIYPLAEVICERFSESVKSLLY